jgi:hypothetical protein
MIYSRGFGRREAFMNPLSASDVFLTVAIMSVTFLTEVGLVILIGNALKGTRDLGNARPMRGLGLRKLDG